MISEPDFVFLSKIPLFRELDDDQIGKLSARLIATVQTKGTTLFKQGDVALSLFIIRKGSVNIQRTEATSEEKDIQLCQLTTGDVFGEFSLLNTGHRLTTAVVHESSALFELTRQDFVSLVNEDPWFGNFVIKAIARRLLAPFQQHADLFFKALKTL
ncbi:Crp/Fnr family transcriptional regulator [candidate division CSSED10-310 bacterium]|uniref:Crp/Fnr family transcriptional regulator n=1 Tax=candidate division CSSED10-310 bacterium TaxID=2855610 RepID=A0ABV6YRD7_UNCC1